MGEDKTVKMIRCPDCKDKPNPACKACGGCGMVVPGAPPK